MSIWEFGLTDEPLAAIKTRAKTIEARLNTGKFAQFAPEDVVHVRRDAFDADGATQDGEPDVMRLKVVAVRRYADFAALLHAEGWRRVIPWVDSDEAALSEFEKYYSPEKQAAYGVVAIEIVPMMSVAAWNATYEKDVDYNQLSDADVAQLVGFLPGNVPHTALDIGCGTGRLVRQLKQAGLEASGVDPSDVAIARALAEDPSGEYRVGDIAAVSGMFGVITCKLVYAFIEDKEQFLRDAAKRLDPQGFFVLLAPTHNRPINHKKGIHVDRDTMLRQVRAQFRIVYRQQTRLGLLVVCTKVAK